jgi:hypothetical protein
MENTDKILVGNLKGREHLGDPSVDGRVILKSHFNKNGY